MVEVKKRTGVKVCGWISDSVFSRLQELGYNSHTVIVRKGAELLIGQPIGERGELLEGTVEYPMFSQNSNTENSREQIENTKEQLELVREYEGTIKELKAQNGEQREHIETLKIELEKAHHDKDDIKNLYDNYMRQMQTLIQQKAIKAPGEETKRWWKFW